MGRTRMKKKDVDGAGPLSRAECHTFLVFVQRRRFVRHIGTQSIAPTFQLSDPSIRSFVWRLAAR